MNQACVTDITRHSRDRIVSVSSDYLTYLSLILCSVHKFIAFVSVHIFSVFFDSRVSAYDSDLSSLSELVLTLTKAALERELTLLHEEVPDLCDDVAVRPPTLTLSLNRTLDGLPWARIDDSRSLVVAAERPRGCRA
jgi:hypothetical protein